MKIIDQSLTRLGVFTARPAAFLILAVYLAVWVIIDRQSINLHSAATMATWLMTLLIQRAEHRDTQAIHAKLDELLRTDPRARKEVATIDEQEAEDIEARREQEKRRGSRRASAKQT
jgi:low affinity Fe/Cu permease